jgi:hypothetical protein
LKYAEALQLRCLNSFGDSILDTGVECLLLGRFAIGSELLQKARVFLAAAIEQQEIPRGYRRGGAECHRLRDYVMCNWFLDGQQDTALLKEAVRWKEIWFAETGESNKTEVQLSLSGYLDAEEYDALFARFDAAKLKPPNKLSSIRGQGTMCYVLARHRLGLEYSDEEVKKALKTFFKRNVQPEWLDFGHATTVALWMKIAYWKPGDDPIATLLKCYEFMPEFEPPKYP